MKRKILAMLMAIMMVVSIVPMSVFATTEAIQNWQIGNEWVSGKGHIIEIETFLWDRQKGETTNKIVGIGDEPLTFVLWGYMEGVYPIKRQQIGTITIDENGYGVCKDLDVEMLQDGWLIDCDPDPETFGQDAVNGVTTYDWNWETAVAGQPGIRQIEPGNLLGNITTGTNLNTVIRLGRKQNPSNPNSDLITTDWRESGFYVRFTCYLVPSYTVTFDTNGGVATDGSTVSIPSQKVTPTNLNPSPVIRPVNEEIKLVKKGFNFGGWVIEDTGALFDFENSRIDRSFTLVANWIERGESSLTINANGGVFEDGKGEKIQKGKVGDDVILTLETPTRTGYSFKNWSGTLPATLPETPAVISAIWNIDTYGVEYAGLEGATVTNPATYTIETEDITLNNPTKEGHTFLGWTGTGLEEATKTVTIPKGSTGDREYTATWEKNSYTVTYMLDGASYGNEDTVEYGDTVTVRAPYTAKEGHTAGEWTSTDVTIENGKFQMPAKDVTITATSVLNKYTISWDTDGDGNVDETTTAKHGTTPSYGKTPTKAATDEHSFTFAGWNPTPVAATQNTTYTAKFDSAVNKYTVTWKNGETVLEKDENVEYGTKPSYDGATPTKAATAQYTYTFDGWDKDVVAVTGDVTYNAQFDSAVNKYTVTWLDGDGKTLYSEDLPYGTTPAYTGETPTKTATDEFRYEFNGNWSPEITSVVEDATYTAQFTEIKNQYTLTVNYSGAYDWTPESCFEEVTVGEGYEVVSPDLTEEGFAPDMDVVEGTMPADDVTVDVTYSCIHEKDFFDMCSDRDCQHPDDCICNPDVTDGVRTLNIISRDNTWERIANVPVVLMMNPNTGWNDKHVELYYGITDENGNLEVSEEVLAEVLPGSSLYVSVTAPRDEEGNELEATHDWAWTDLSYGKLRTVNALANVGVVQDEGKNEYAYIAAGEGAGFTADIFIYVLPVEEVSPVVGLVKYIVVDTNGEPIDTPTEQIVMSLNKRENGKATHIGTTAIINGVGQIEIDAAELARLKVGTILDCDPTVGHYEWALGSVPLVRTMEIDSGSIAFGKNVNHDAVITEESLKNGFEITFTCVLRDVNAEPAEPVVEGRITFAVTDKDSNPVSCTMNLNQRYLGKAKVIGSVEVVDGIGTLILDAEKLAALPVGAVLDCDPVAPYEWALDQVEFVRTVSGMYGAITKGTNVNHDAMVVKATAAEGFAFTFNCIVK